MSVNKGDRRESKVEFDNTYFKVYDDCVKYKKKLEQGQMSLLDIQNCYKSWRNNILKDCNACCRSIHEMDKLFERLFLKHESYRKVTREQLIRKAYREAYNGKGIFR